MKLEMRKRTLSEWFWSIFLLGGEGGAMILMLWSTQLRPYEYQGGDLQAFPFGVIGMIVFMMIMTYLAFAGREEVKDV